MSQFVTRSYRNPRAADTAIGHLLDNGHSRTGTSVIMTDRTRRSYVGKTSMSPIGAIMAAPGVNSTSMSMDDLDDVGTPLSIGGPLSQDVERGIRNSNRLIELIESLGASRRDAEAAARDVGRGGVFIAVALPDTDDVAAVRQLIERGSFAAAASRY